MLSILVNFGLIDSEVLVPPEKNVPKGTQLQLASDSLKLFTSPNQPISRDDCWKWDKERGCVKEEQLRDNEK